MRKEFEMKPDQRRLELLLDVVGGSHGVTMICFDEIDQVWLVNFRDRTSYNTWGHLTHWVGVPVRKTIGEIVTHGKS